MPYLESETIKMHAQVSPNGRWLAYDTNESGTFQIVIQCFPDPKISKTVISRGGGMQPRWRRDGLELFYLTPEGTLMAVPVKTGDAFEAGPETALFKTSLAPERASLGFLYDVTADGKRFLMISPMQSAPSANAADATPSPLWSIGPLPSRNKCAISSPHSSQ